MMEPALMAVIQDTMDLSVRRHVHPDVIRQDATRTQVPVTSVRTDTMGRNVK